ncbi:MAG: hypothetical protein LBV52_04180, partial [Spirochaetaceae bacterium]|nr:hypothetical protein [Spirochaetaceae bacterium]
MITKINKKILFGIVLVVLCLSCNVVFAQDAKGAKEIFTKYIKCVKKSDYLTAARYIIKEDLDNFKDTLLPLFIALSDSGDQDAESFARLVLGKYEKDPGSITSEVFFANYMNFVMAYQQDLKKMMAESEFNIENVYFNNSDKNLLVIE